MVTKALVLEAGAVEGTPKSPKLHDVFFCVRGTDGKLFARERMSYMAAIVMRAAWERAHMDDDRVISIESF